MSPFSITINWPKKKITIKRKGEFWEELSHKEPKGFYIIKGRR